MLTFEHLTPLTDISVLHRDGVPAITLFDFAIHWTVIVVC